MASKQKSAELEMNLKRLMKGDMCFAMRARRLSRIMTRSYEEALRGTGLTLPQFTLLALVTIRGPVTAVEIGRLLDIEKSTLSRTIGKMMEKGWLEDFHTDEGRQGIITTLAGRDTLAKAIPFWRDAQDRARKAFGKGGAEMLDQMITRAHEI